MNKEESRAKKNEDGVLLAESLDITYRWKKYINEFYTVSDKQTDLELYHLQVYLAKMKNNLAEMKFNLAQMKINLAQTKFNLAQTKFNLVQMKFNLAQMKFKLTLMKLYPVSYLLFSYFGII